jgi:ABC-type multidrug transport system fused ATPase/permease subunit
VLKIIRQSVKFMSPTERTKYFTFLTLRAFVAVFDLVGILAIGYLATSIALFITLGSDSRRVIEFAGLSLSAVNSQTLPLIAILILTLFVAKAFLSVLLTKQLAQFLARIEARAARDAASAAFGNGMDEARKYTREEIYFAVQSGSPAAFNFILNSVGIIAAESLLFIMILGSFFLVDPWSAVAAIFYFGLVALVIQFFIGRKMEKAGRRNTEATVEANLAIGDLSEVLREASILSKKHYFFDRIFDARTRAADSFATQFVLSGMPRYIVETALIVAVALFVVAQSLTGDLVGASGTVGVFLSGGLRLTASLLPLQSALLSVKQFMPQAERALNLLSERSSNYCSESRDQVDSQESLAGVGVKLECVNFSYPNTQVKSIHSVSLQIYPGQQAAFIGPSGSGKSTLADLILGLLEPTQGKVELLNRDGQSITRQVPGLLGYVPQKPGMISGTISDNIALGVAPEDLDKFRLHDAIAEAHLSNLVESLPGGINSELGKRKDELSGGQLQRIGLARALYTQPSLLVMDEATSALDADSENEINKAIDELRGKVTVILIAHRLNTVQRSDIVFLVEEGRITASGTFSELLRTNNTVKKLADLMAIDSND